MRPRRGWWLLWLVPLLGAVIVLSAAFRHSQSFLLFTSPLLVGIVGSALLGYRRRHGFWPWDRKRRKIEQWAWLVADEPDDERGPRKSAF